MADDRKAFDFYSYVFDTSKYLKTFIKQRREIADLFNIPTLTKGTDSFEIRFMPINNFIGANAHIFQFKLDSNGWRGYHYFSYSMPITLSESRKVKMSDAFNLGDSVLVVQAIQPICGWDKFIDSINYFGIPHFPGRHEIKDFEPGTWVEAHRYGYEVEIATPNSYRFLEYHIPELYPDSTNKKFAAFVEMVQRQLGDTYDWPNNLTSRKPSDPN